MHAQASFDITGANRLTIYRTLYSNRGPMEVCIDTACQMVQNYSEPVQWQQPVEFDVSSTATHTVTIRNPSSAYIDLDAIRVELVP